ncbi:neurturin [Thalassophryne amazonica]|uniref:neurturin n=1 Tax=Thalassophryne amazonica TaxID=390379 RepID=UPI001472508B|nr:neurturin [Thalassophryne amazonica]
MKLWKSATCAFTLCSTALSILLVRNMATTGHFKPKTKHTASSSSRLSLSSESSSSSRTSSASSLSASSAALPLATGGVQRRIRSADNMNSLLSEFSTIFQSFTESELQHVLRTLLERRRRKTRRLDDSQARRTKRARRPRPCSVRELELTVSELGLGYESDETVLFRYCSGKCMGHRRNYDITVEHMRQTAFSQKVRKDKVSSGPCCRPTAYEEDISFLDNKSRYHTIQNVSAKNCGCV